MTDTSLFHESDVTTRSGYGSARWVLVFRPRSGTPMTPRMTTPDNELVPCIARAMVTSQGYGLLAELIATALLIAALTGFFVQRSKPWLVGVTMAFMLFIVAATVVVGLST